MPRRRARRLSQAGRRGPARPGRRGAGSGARGRCRGEAVGAIELDEQRYVEMSAVEQFVLTLSERGYGKRSSSYEYRITGRGGKGIVAMDIWEGKKGTRRSEKIGRLVASFPVEESDQIMLVTDGGQLIRCPVERHPHRGPRDAGRDRVQHRGRRARRLGRAASAKRAKRTADDAIGTASNRGPATTRSLPITTSRRADISARRCCQLTCVAVPLHSSVTNLACVQRAHP